MKWLHVFLFRSVHKSVVVCCCFFVISVHHLISVGVSLLLQGKTIPNNSLVNLDDLLYRTDTLQPTNANGLQTLMCVTDLVDCCETQRLGNWYYPNGRIITSRSQGNTFQTNRGQNEIVNNQQFYGSVRLWRRYTPAGRGLFRCELPDAKNVIQTLYVNICELCSTCTHISLCTYAFHMQCFLSQ